MRYVIHDPITNEEGWHYGLSCIHEGEIVYILPHTFDSSIVLTSEITSEDRQSYSDFVCSGVQREFLELIDMYLMTQSALNYVEYDPDYNTDEECIELLCQEELERFEKMFKTGITVQADEVVLQLIKSIPGDIECIAKSGGARVGMTYDAIDEANYHGRGH